MTVQDIPAWDPIGVKGSPTATDFHFALIIDDVVQTVMGASTQLASVINANPEFVRCGETAWPGMTRQQAIDTVTTPAVAPDTE